MTRVSWPKAGARLATEALLLLAGCTQESAEAERFNRTVQQGIYGGTPVAATAYPEVGWLASGCTATLVHPEVIVFAAHCGAVQEAVWWGDVLELDPNVPAGSSLVPAGGAASSPIKYCRVHPEAAPASGLDVGYCLLETPMSGVPVVPIATPAEYGELVEGDPATLVGYGFDSETDTGLGVKRSVQASIVRVGSEIIIGDDQTGSCRGDSGGPAFLRLQAPTPPTSEWRLAGVLSTGEAGSCGAGRYTDLWRNIEWLQEETQRNLTPCVGPEGNWSPSAACLVPAMDADGVALADEPQASALGGAPFSPVNDTTPPTLDWVVVAETVATPDQRLSDQPGPSADATPAVKVSVRADDRGGSGVERVTVTLRSDNGQVIATASDELLPYEFILPSQPAHHPTITAVATDFAGNETVLERPVTPKRASSCSAGPGPPSYPGPSVLMLLVLPMLGWLARCQGSPTN